MIQHKEETVNNSGSFFIAPLPTLFLLSLLPTRRYQTQNHKRTGKKTNISSLGALRKPPSKAVMSLDCVR